jgi:hypothetical protein
MKKTIWFCVKAGILIMYLSLFRLLIDSIIDGWGTIQVYQKVSVWGLFLVVMLLTFDILRMIRSWESEKK